MLETRFTCLLAIAGLLSACAPAGYHYETGSLVQTPNSDAVRAEMTAPSAPPGMPAHHETYEDGRAWENRIKSGACTRIRDRRYDREEDVAECNRDYASIPMCVDYKNYAKIWFDMADNPMPNVDTLTFQTNVINGFAANSTPSTPPYYASGQYRAMLQRLLLAAVAPNRRTQWGNSDQFSGFAYKSCIEGHPF